MSQQFEMQSLGSRQYGIIRPEYPNGDICFVLHGSKQTGRVIRTFSNRCFDTYTQYGITVVYPDGIGRNWNDARRHMDLVTRQAGTDDVGFLCELAQHLGAQRIYGVGFSNGGEMIIRLLHDQPGLLAAAAVVAATQPAADNFLCHTENWIATPLLLVTGQEDPVYPVNGGDMRGKVLSAAATARYYAELNDATLAAEDTTEFGLHRRYSGNAAVEQWELSGVGHVVPSNKVITSKFLGPARTDWNTASYFARLAGWQTTQ